jgi:hypothetical protein
MSSDNYFLLVIGAGFGWLCFVGLGSWVAMQKNRSEGEGALLALIFGPFGVLIEALLPDNPR